MSVYRTEQKRMLMEFMTLNKDNSFTIDEIEAGLKEINEGEATPPGKSTLYRLINRLVNEGKVRRFVGADGRKSSYQLVAGEHCELHLHLKCKDCGRLFHMDENVSEELVKRISACSDFSVDEGESVLYGKCAGCNNKQRI